ncbi:MAG: pyruvate dehydrogenase complex dihydrolipoamide acetyltransferase [Amphritea sp.]
MPVEIKLPAITPDFDAGTISSWTKAVGDPVTKGDVIFEVETDKAVIEVEAEESGVLGKIVVDAGVADVPVNATVGLLLKEGESSAALDQFAVSSSAEGSVVPDAVTEHSAVIELATGTSRAVGSAVETRVFSSPLARRIASNSDVDLTLLSGRGPNGRILKADVQDFIAASAKQSSNRSETETAPKPEKVAVVEGAYKTIKHSSMRKIIAERLVQSKSEIPHFYLTVECEIDALQGLRQQLNSETPQGDDSFKLTVNDFVIKASALALRDVPEVNSSWTPDAALQYDDVDISVAVSTDDGLITPIVRKADTKGLAVISNQVKELAGRAREGRLKPNEYKGGGFSISNLGMYGISSFNAIINPPQSCILAVGAAEKKPVVKGDELAIATVLNCTLSVDHRVVDGAVGARFLKAFKHYIENPTHMILRGG